MTRAGGGAAGLPPSAPVVAWSDGERHVRWTFRGASAVREFPEPPLSVTAWADPPCVVVVEHPSTVEGPANAVVLDPDGSELQRLRPPELSGAVLRAFYAVFADPEGLVAVLDTTGGDHWGRPDLRSGHVTLVGRWR